MLLIAILTFLCCASSHAFRVIPNRLARPQENRCRTALFAETPTPETSVAPMSPGSEIVIPGSIAVLLPY